MYIVAIGWAYVIVMMAAASGSVVKALSILVFLGALPLGLFIYLFDRPRRRRSRAVADQVADQRDTADPESDQH